MKKQYDIELTLDNNRFHMIWVGKEENIYKLGRIARDLLIYKNPLVHDAEILHSVKGWSIPRHLPRLIMMARSADDGLGYRDIPIGLFPRVSEALKVSGLRVIVQDIGHGSSKIIRNDLVSEDFSASSLLRPYQNLIVASLSKTRRAMVVSMTGSGKTIMMSHVIKHLSCPAIVLVHRRILISQWKEAIKSVLEASPYTLSGGKVTKGDCPVLIATFQSIGGTNNLISEKTLLTRRELDPITGCTYGSGIFPNDFNALRQNRISELKEAGFDGLEKDKLLVIVDEAHVAPAFGYYSILASLRPTYTFGCTATPDRKDKRDMFMEAVFSDRKFYTEASEVSKYLSPMIYMTLTIRAYMTNLEEQIGASDVLMDHEFVRALVSDPMRLSVIMGAIKSLVKLGKSVAVVCGNNLWLIDSLQSALDIADVPHRTITGKVSDKDREAILSEISYKKVKVLLATTTVDEGVDIPSLDALIYAIPFTSQINTIQRAGRVARRHPGKKCGFIIDILDGKIFKAYKAWRQRRAVILKTFEINQVVTLEHPTEAETSEAILKGEENV